MRLAPLARWGKSPTDPAHLARWLRTPRVNQSAADYASPLTCYTSDVRMWEGIAAVMLAVCIGVGLAAWLVVYWSA